MQSRTLVLISLLALASSGCAGAPDDPADRSGPTRTADAAATSSATPPPAAAPDVVAATAADVEVTTAADVVAETADPKPTSSQDDRPQAASGPQVCGLVPSVTDPVYIEIIRGSLTCEEAESLLATYYHDPPAPPEGSGGYVRIGEWGCITSSAGSDSLRASTCTTEALDEVAAWKEEPILEKGMEWPGPAEGNDPADDPAGPEAAEGRPGPGDTALQTYEVADRAVFTTPARAAYCILSTNEHRTTASVYCEVQASTLPAGHGLLGVCPDDYGYFVEFVPGQDQEFWCNHYATIRSETRPLGSDDGWVSPSATETLPSGQVIGVLQYGQVLRHGTIECSVQPDGLTCTDGSHGVVLSTGHHESW